MFNRFYLRLLLAVLPTAEDFLKKFAALMVKLDKLTDRLEKYLEENAVKLAQDAAQRRVAIQAINDSFNRRDNATLDTIQGLRSKLDLASTARDAVDDFLTRIK